MFVKTDRIVIVVRMFMTIITTKKSRAEQSQSKPERSSVIIIWPTSKTRQNLLNNRIIIKYSKSKGHNCPRETENLFGKIGKISEEFSRTIQELFLKVIPWNYRKKLSVVISEINSLGNLKEILQNFLMKFPRISE